MVYAREPSFRGANGRMEKPRARVHGVLDAESVYHGKRGISDGESLYGDWHEVEWILSDFL